MIDVKVSRDGVDDDEPPSSDWVERVVKQALSTAEVEDSCEVSVLLTDDPTIQQLNRDYRGFDKPTDVLSFAFEEDDTVKLPPGVPRMLGDVIVSLETVARQAAQNSHATSRETAWALCHGVLHLVGYDHQTDEEEASMRSLEGSVLKGLGEGFYSW